MNLFLFVVVFVVLALSFAVLVVTFCEDSFDEL